MEEAKKMKCYKRLIYKQFVQASGLCGPRIFVELWLETPFWCTNMASGKQQKHLVFTSSINLFVLTRELAYVRINISSNTWNGYSAENQKDFFFNETAFLMILVSRTMKTRKFKLLYFRNEKSYGNGNLYKDLLFVFLQPSVNRNA